MDAEPDYLALFEALAGPHLVVRAEPGFPIVRVSPTYARAFLSGDEELVSRPVAEALARFAACERSGLQALPASLADALRTGEPQNLPPLRCPNAETGGGGERFWLPVNVPARDRTGAIRWIIHRMEEATESVHQQAELEVERIRDQLIVENLQDYAIFMLDETGRVRSWNRGAERLLGYTETEILGQDAAILFTPEDRARGEHVKELTTALNAGRAMDDRWHLRKDGTRFFVTGLMTLLRHPNGRRIGLVKIMRDVTDRQLAQAERELLLESERVARAEAERTSRLKDEFLANLSHELRTPLNAILGWTQVLQMRGSDPDELAQGLEVIDRNTRVQAQLIDDLLDMSRIVSGKLRLDLQRIAVAGPIEAAIESVRPAASAKQIALNVAVREPGLAIMGDRNRLQQVVWNLLANAIKFTPLHGSVEVQVERQGPHVAVMVRDNGVGIAAEFLPHVFERFRQADASITRQHAGLGLGLAIVKQLVELHGGDVWAESVGLGHGSTFTFRLPVAEAAGVSLAEPAPASPAPAGATLHGVHVLAVDDEPDSLRLVQRLLAGAGARVTTAASMTEALALLEQQVPDVLVSDIGMPQHDGYELIRRVRARPETARLPAAALTALVRTADRTRAMQAGFQTHVCKPIEAPELIAVVTSLAALRGLGRSAGGPPRP